MSFLCFMFFLNKRLDGGAVGVVLIQFNKRCRPAAENVNKQRHLRSPLEASSQLQKNVIVVVGCKKQWQHYLQNRKTITKLRGEQQQPFLCTQKPENSEQRNMNDLCQKQTTRHWKYHLFFDIISYHIICQKNDIISFISYR
jgi:hypothetical protein